MKGKKLISSVIIENGVNVLVIENHSALLNISGIYNFSLISKEAESVEQLYILCSNNNVIKKFKCLEGVYHEMTKDCYFLFYTKRQINIKQINYLLFFHMLLNVSCFF